MARKTMVAIAGLLVIIVGTWSVTRWRSPRRKEAPHLHAQPARRASFKEIKEAEDRKYLQHFNSNKAAIASVLTAPDLFEAFRVYPFSQLPRRAGADLSRRELARARRINRRIDEWPVLTVAAKPNRQTIQRLTAILLNPKSYLAPNRDMKACMFQPGVAFHAEKAEYGVDIVICFQCRQLYARETNISQTRQKGEKARTPARIGGDFDPAYNRLMTLVKGIFPSDREIQSLPKR